MKHYELPIVILLYSLGVFCLGYHCGMFQGWAIGFKAAACAVTNNDVYCK